MPSKRHSAGSMRFSSNEVSLQILLYSTQISGYCSLSLARSRNWDNIIYLAKQSSSSTFSAPYDNGIVASSDKPLSSSALSHNTYNSKSAAALHKILSLWFKLYQWSKKAVLLSVSVICSINFVRRMYATLSSSSLIGLSGRCVSSHSPVSVNSSSASCIPISSISCE